MKEAYHEDAQCTLFFYICGNHLNDSYQAIQKIKQCGFIEQHSSLTYGEVSIQYA